MSDTLAGASPCTEIEQSEKKAGDMPDLLGDCQVMLAPVRDAAPIAPEPTAAPNQIIEGWCYAGRYDPSSGWRDVTIQSPPSKGEISNGAAVTAATPVYFRVAPRTKDSQTAGAQRGAVLPGAILQVSGVQRFDDTHSVWLHVQVKNIDHYVPVSLTAAD